MKPSFQPLFFWNFYSIIFKNEMSAPALSPTADQIISSFEVLSFQSSTQDEIV